MTYYKNFGGNDTAEHDQDVLTSSAPTTRRGWQSLMWRKFQGFLKRKQDAQMDLDGFSLSNQFVISAWAVGATSERVQNTVRSQFQNASAFLGNLDASEAARFAIHALQNGVDPYNLARLAIDVADS